MEPQYTREKLLITPEQLENQIGDPGLCVIDVRPAEQFAQGHIPGARRIDEEALFDGPGLPKTGSQIRAAVGVPEGDEVIAYCHSGSRSARATLALRAAGYHARNYAGSWHEWSRHPELPLAK